MHSGGPRYRVAYNTVPPPPSPPLPLQIIHGPAYASYRDATRRGRALYGGNGGGVDPESLEKDNDANIHALGDRVGLLRQVQIHCSIAAPHAWVLMYVATV